jgi:Exopolyphosphatase
VAIGASGTVRGVWRVVMAQGWADERITRSALEKAVSLVVNAGNVRKLDLPGLREDRQPVFAGGLAVLAGVFDTLELDAMLTSASALREGLVFDLVGRLHDDDVRSRAVEALARRYAVDRRQAAAVERTALRCLEQVAAAWKLDARTAGQYLRWAARLHEVGLAVAHAGFHRHGEYLLRYGDLAGFSQTEQQMLAVLVRLQRGRFHSDLIDALPKSRRSMLRRLAMLFRLSVLLHRSRGVIRGMPLRLEVTGGRALRVSLPQRWLDARPLTEADLLAEAQLLAAAGLKLELVK